jgi:phosphoglycerate dehydrogenase-like enzyme
MAEEITQSVFRVLVADPIDQAGIDLLKEGGLQVEVKFGLTEDELCQFIGNYQALIVRSATKVTERVIEKAFQLSVIARAGAGLDTIDVVAAKAQSVGVVNAPDANTLAVAEHTMGLMLALARRLPQADASLKHGLWEKSALVGTGLAGKILGIIGFGRIGREVAKRAQAFGMQVVVNQRRLTPELALEKGVTPMDLVDLLKMADFVSLHVPLKPETEGLIGKEELALIKEGAYLINTARGGVIDETALLTALESGRLAGAALDVFAQEPAVDSALARHPRVIATPHIAANTGDAQRAAAITVAEQILEVATVIETDNFLSLQVLPLDKVIPHERVDPERVARLRQVLKKDMKLKNPPVVTEWQECYVVLDGATRVTALKEMGFQYIVAQVVAHNDGKITLQAWSHVKQGIEVEDLFRSLSSLPEIRLTPANLDFIQDMMVEQGGLCYLIFPNKKAFVIEATPGCNRLDALNKLVTTYIEGGQVARTTHSDFAAVKHKFPDMSGLFVFPTFSVDQVLQISKAGKVLPAGITRFIIPGRVLRVNIDLKRLAKDESAALKSVWLNQVISNLQVNHRIRYYEEPVYLLDE